jgi:phage-related protein
MKQKNNKPENKKKEWHVIYYSDSDNKCEVKDFIKSLDLEERKKVLAWIEQLQIQGPNLPRPYADFLKDGIHELRIQTSGEKNRILYFFCYVNFIVLTHQFIKTTKEVPEKEIKKSIKLMKDFLERFDEKTIINEFKKST